MKAVILCGGEGTRLRPYTYNVPKPMLKLGSKPILEYVLLNLKRAGVKDFILTVGYLKEQIMDYFKDGSQWGINIEYSVETEKLNTAGSVLQTKDKINDTFIVAMGDHVTSIDMRAFYEYHKKQGGIASIALKMRGTPVEYGIVEVNDDNSVAQFREKPILTNLVNAGIYVFEPEIFNYIKPKEDFAKDVFPRLLKEGKKIYGYKFSEYWMDVGRVHDYEMMNSILSVAELAIELRK